MKTAVEWLAKELESYGDPQICTITWEDLDSLVNQAKQMEKEQIIEAYRKGVEEDVYVNPLKTGTQYFNETFKTKNQ